MQDNVAPPPPRRRIGRTQKLFETAVNSGFDQIIKGDVIIKKLKNKHEYRITFSKVYGDRFFFYQVFNKDNTNSVNDQRFAAYITTKNYINVYNFYNDTSNIINKLVFTPTTIMELSNFSKYAFVINRAYFNSYKRLVFIVSTKEINLQNNTSKKLTQIPSGKFKHVRFDIDDLTYSQILFMKISKLWSYINNQCASNINSTQTFRGKQYKICDKPMPLYPSVCDDKYVSVLRNQQDPCSIKLREMLNNDSFPEVLSFLSRTGQIADNYNCNDNDCDIFNECRLGPT
jgi:hypothetical protein